jgi:hypothetical protein
MWRLSFDFVRRKWLDNFWMWFILAMAVPRLASGFDGPVSFGIALSLLFGVIAGPAFALGLRVPELRFLPLARRDIWRAGWILAVLMPALLLALGMTIGLLIHRLPLSPSSIALVVLIAVVYLGALMGVASVYPLSPRHARWDRGVRILNLAIGVMFLGSPFWGIVLRHSLPNSWADVRGWMAVVLAIGAALTVAGFACSPAEDAPFGRGLLRAKTASAQQSLKPKPSAATDDGVTGLQVLVRSTARMSAICLAIFVALDALFFHSLLALAPTHWPPVVQGQGQNLPMFFGFGLTALLQGAKTGQQSIRHLRTLPLDDWQLTGLLLGLPILQGVIWWAGLAAVHLVLGGWLPQLLRPELFLTLIAAGAIMTAGALLPKHGWLIIVGMVAILALVFVDDDSVPDAATAAILNGIAMVALAGSAWMIQRGLNRSRALYEAPPAVQRWRGFARSR